MDRSGKIKAGAVSYLNTRPLIYGFEKGMMKEEIILIKEYPSKIAEMLLHGEIDLGLIPVAAIPSLKESHIITDYCIGCEGPVASVCIFSEVPIHKIERLLLDYQSRSSVKLATILLNRYWKISPKLIQTTTDFSDQIKGSTAGLVIGDRAFEQRQALPHIYDLGEAWVDFTGLPFVFATWVANKSLPQEIITRFQQATGHGLLNLDKVIAENPYETYDLKKYYTQNISFTLNAEKRKGMELFLTLLQTPALPL